MQKKDCAGCRDDFYNGHNPLGVSECWHFDRTKALETRYRLSVHTPMNIKSAYRKVRVPPCYGMDGFIHCKQIPAYAK